METDWNADRTSAAEEESPRDLEAALALGEFVDRAASGNSPRLLDFLAEHAALASELAGPLLVLEEMSSIVQEPVQPASFGDFRILREAGNGAMGIVYEAWQASLNRRVALKVLPSALLSVPRAVARFQREAKLAASLDHPNIVRIYSTGTERGVPYFAMEFVPGETLRQIQDRLGTEGESVLPGLGTLDAEARDTAFMPIRASSMRPRLIVDGSTGALGQALTRTGKGGYGPPLELSPASIRGIASAFAEVAEGLQHAHSKGIIHRDIKPSNLLLDSGGHLRILDFGLALLESDPRLTQTAACVGTPLYMSPEQSRGTRTELGRGADIYSLGATLYDLLAGRPPVTGRNVEEVLDRIVHVDPVPLRSINPRVPLDLDTIVMKCLRKEARERYATAEAVAQDLFRFVRGDPIEARPQPAYVKLARRAWRSRRVLLEAGAAALILGAALIFGILAIAESSSRRQEELEKIARSASAAITQGPVIRASSSIREVVGEGVRLPLPRGETVLSTRQDGGSHSLCEVGADAIEAGPSLVGAAPDPVKQAVSRLREVAASWGSAACLYHLARGLILLERLDDAEVELRKAIELDPIFVPALTLLASVHESKGEASSAREFEAAAVKASASGPPWSAVWLRAHRALVRRDWKEAAQAYGELIRLQSEGKEHFLGSGLEAKMGRGLALLAHGDRTSALADFSAALERSTTELQPALLLGKTFYITGPRERVAEIFDSLAGNAASERYEETVLAIAITYGELRDFDAVLSWLEKIGQSPTRQVLEAEALRHLGRFEAALSVATDASKTWPLDTSTHLTLGNVLLSMDSFAEARDSYGRAAELDARDARPVAALGICSEIAGDLARAEAELRSALALDPQLVSTHYNLGRVLRKRGRVAESVEHYERCLELDSTHAQAANNLATLMDNEGKLDKAIELYERAVRLAPNLALVHFNLGWAYHRQMRFDKAATRYKEAIRLGLDDAVTYNNLAPCLQHLGSIDEAIAAYQRALALYAESTPPQQRALTQHSLATALEYRKDLPSMIAAYSEAVRLHPDWLEARSDLGWALHRQGRHGEALRQYDRAIDLDPTFIWPYNNLASLVLAHEEHFPERGDLPRMIRKLEGVEGLPNSSPAMECLLDKCRRALAPDFASFASIDAHLDGPIDLVPRGATWRYWHGDAEPAETWQTLSFDDRDWRLGASDKETRGEDSSTAIPPRARSRPSLYLRHGFRVADPAGLEKIILTVRAGDGFVAYLNGEEVGRLRAGSRGEIRRSNSGADGDEQEPWISRKLTLEREHLRAGDNVLAVQVLQHWSASTAMTIDLALGAVEAGNASARRRAATALEQLRATEPNGPLTAYLEGRLLRLEGNIDAASDRMQRVIALDSSSPEPFLQLAECLEETSSAEAAAGCLREALERGLHRHRKLWDAWLEVSFLGQGLEPAALKAGFPSLAPEDRKGFPADVLWLLERLEEDAAVRINCGGKEYRDADRNVWGEDRFFRNGYPQYAPAEEWFLGSADEEALHRTRRGYYEPETVIEAYSIPLPPGTYQVTLRFGPLETASAVDEGFDVWLEGNRHAGGEWAVKGPARQGAHDVQVIDGVLDLSFERRGRHPVVTALLIQRL